MLIPNPETPAPFREMLLSSLLDVSGGRYPDLWRHKFRASPLSVPSCDFSQTFSPDWPFIAAISVISET
jgi:hypothetical protein